MINKFGVEFGSVLSGRLVKGAGLADAYVHVWVGSKEIFDGFVVPREGEDYTEAFARIFSESFAEMKKELMKLAELTKREALPEDN